MHRLQNTATIFPKWTFIIEKARVGKDAVIKVIYKRFTEQLGS